MGPSGPRQSGKLMGPSGPRQSGKLVAMGDGQMPRLCATTGRRSFQMNPS